MILKRTGAGVKKCWMLSWTLLLVLAGGAALAENKDSASASPQTMVSPAANGQTLTPEEQKKLDELREEREVGRNMSGRLLAHFGTYKDDQLLGYINQVGTYVGGFNEDPDRRYMFEIIDTDMINAFAAPGGYILITLGALRHARNEAEIAAVLAHETVHVSKRHVYNTLRSMSKEDLEKAAGEKMGGKNVGPELAMRKRPDPEESKAGALLARYLSGATAGLNVLAAAKAGMNVLMEKGLGADLEYEADALGVRNAVMAGYHPSALNDYLCRIDQVRRGKTGKCVIEKEQLKKGQGEKSILEKTHPPIASRIDSIQKSLEQMKAEEIVGALGVKRYKQFIAKIPKAKKSAEKKH
jgi:predicted Zn-dependent protease